MRIGSKSLPGNQKRERRKSERDFSAGTKRREQVGAFEVWFFGFQFSENSRVKNLEDSKRL